VLSGGDTQNLQLTQDDLHAIFAPLSEDAAPARRARIAAE
jgi:hypothetical protein